MFLAPRKRWRRIALLAFPTLLTGVAYGQSTVDASICASTSGSPEARISACTSAIGSGQLSAINLAITFYNRGAILARGGDFERAISDYNESLRLNPQDADTLYERGRAWKKSGDNERAIEDYRQAIRLNPQYAKAYNNIAWVLATAKVATYRNGSRAVEYAQKACEISAWKDPADLDTLAAAYAEVGDFDAAIRWQLKTLEFPGFAERAGDTARARLELYRQGQPYRE
jgi:tetratricopeptide (TPR) repeat protein